MSIKVKPSFASGEGSTDITIPHQNGFTHEIVARLFNLPGRPGTSVCWNGHEFEIGQLFVYSNNPFDGRWSCSIGMADHSNDQRFHPAMEFVMHVYYPIDQRTTEIDWKGATRVYMNETKDAWLPAHCNAEYHHDHELRLADVVTSLFQPEIDALQLDVMTKLRTLAGNPSDSSAGSRELTARLKLTNMMTVRGEVLECIEKKAREKYLGWYHQNPDRSHLHQEIAGCLGNLIEFNNRAKSVVYGSVATELQRILTNLNAKHSYETRWDYAARIKAEAEKAAAESASDSGSEESSSESEE